MAEQRETDEQREKADNSPTSVIGADLVITGNIESASGLLIEGRVTGDVRCSSLMLGENSLVAGSIAADRIRILGSVDGGVECKELSIEATGRVTGDVQYERVKIASGGIVDGNLKCRNADRGAEAAKLKLVATPAATAAPAKNGKADDHIFIE